MAANRGAIEEEVLAELVDAGLTTREIAARVDRSYATVRHWLKRYGLETEYERRIVALAAARVGGPTDIELRCRHCGPTTHRYSRSGDGFVCLRCRSRSVTQRRRRVKALLVAEAGGRCVRCRYAGSLAALQFHHLDPATKEFHIAQHGGTRSLERARAEVAKCVLLCANCHAEVEAGLPLADD